MVAEVATRPGAVGVHGDPRFLQDVSWTNSRFHEQQWGAVRPTADYDLLTSMGTMRNPMAVECHSECLPIGVDQYLLDIGVSEDCQVFLHPIPWLHKTLVGTDFLTPVLHEKGG